MENKNVNVEEIKEGVPSVIEEVSNETGNTIVKVAIGASVIGILVGGAVLITKFIKKRKVKTTTEVTEIISESEDINEESAE